MKIPLGMIICFMMGCLFFSASGLGRENKEEQIRVSAICMDGTQSISKRRSGTCSRHGGVKEWMIK